MPQDSNSSESSKEALYLERSHVKFQSPSESLNLYLDECNREIISISRSQETALTSIVVQPIFERKKLKLQLALRKKILCLKLNRDRSILAYHIEHNILEFINLTKKGDEYTLDGKHYTRACSTKNSKFYGFFWTALNEIVFVTDISVEYYHVDQLKRRLKHIRSFTSTTNWFIYQPNHLSYQNSLMTEQIHYDYSVLMVSFGSQGSDIQPYVFTSREVQKMMFFEVDGNWRNSEQLERSVTISRIYGFVRLLVLQHGSPNLKTRGSRIIVYTLNVGTRSTCKTHVLEFDTIGYFALNIVDDLIIGHHQASKTSFIFDIMAQSTEKADCPNHFVSLTDRQSIKCLYLEDEARYADLYSINWVFIQPNFIINPEIGHLMILKLDLDMIPNLICDNPLVLMNFLTCRANSEFVIFRECNNIIMKSFQSSVDGIESTPLTDISTIFEIISHVTESAPSKNTKPPALDTKSSDIGLIYNRCKVSLIQEEFHQHVFKFLTELESTNLQLIISILYEYMFVLRSLDKTVSYVIYEQLAKVLLRNKQYYQLVRMIRSKTFHDSKQLACFLLSIRCEYPSAKQLGIDMFSRLNIQADDSMIETLSSLMDERCQLNNETSTTNQSSVRLPVT